MVRIAYGINFSFLNDDIIYIGGLDDEYYLRKRDLLSAIAHFLLSLDDRFELRLEYGDVLENLSKITEKRRNDPALFIPERSSAERMIRDIFGFY